LPETPTTEPWAGTPPVPHAFRPGSKPEAYMAKIAEGDERLWVPIVEGVYSKPVWISPTLNMWADVLRADKPCIVNRHYHPKPIWAYTISGKWAYLEHDWTATAGDVVSGPLMWLDEQGNTVGHYDVFDYMKAARDHYESVGIGADYVDSLIR